MISFCVLFQRLHKGGNFINEMLKIPEQVIHDLII